MSRTATEERARRAAERLDAARAVGRQMDLLAVEASPADPAELPQRGPGRPAGSRNRRTSKLRQMLAARGFRMPEDLVAETAGLGARGVTGIELAMQRAEQVAAWLEGDGPPLKRDQRQGLFVAIWKEQNAAAASLLPYGLEKLTPDAAPAVVVPIVMPGAGRPGDDARLVEGRATRAFGPPPMPGEVERNQGLALAAPAQSDGRSRTE